MAIEVPKAGPTARHQHAARWLDGRCRCGGCPSRSGRLSRPGQPSCYTAKPTRALNPRRAWEETNNAPLHLQLHQLRRDREHDPGRGSEEPFWTQVPELQEPSVGGERAARRTCVPTVRLHRFAGLPDHHRTLRMDRDLRRQHGHLHSLPRPTTDSWRRRSDQQCCPSGRTMKIKFEPPRRMDWVVPGPATRRSSPLRVPSPVHRHPLGTTSPRNMPRLSTSHA